MEKIINLKLLLLVMIVTLSFSIGNPDWVSPIISVLDMYYFLFTMNLFFKLYEKENFMTRIFLAATKTPMYLAMATMVIVIIFLRKFYPEMNFDSAYLSAFIGVVATTIARFKRGKFTIQY